MRIFHSLGHVLGGALLIAGTTIGVGMLALPVATGPAGFLPSAVLYLICWAFMLATGLLLLEVSLSMPKEFSFLSMAERLLGPAGKALFWVIYLFLFLTVMVAHVAGGASMINDLTGWHLPGWLGILFYVALFSPVVYLGTRSVDRLNMFLISGVILSYLAFLFVSYTDIQLPLLQYADWSKTWIALPVLFTAFTFQVIVPTLVTYMERDIRKIRLAIFIGSAIPLIIYLVWEFFILGIVPPADLAQAALNGHHAVEPLRTKVQNPLLFSIGKYFAFFTLTTSFIPFALAFFDFLADGLKWKKKGAHRIWLYLMIFGIPTLIALAYPHLFLVALGYAGGISCAILFGLMPPLMAWIGRYQKHYPAHNRQLPGGKALLLLLMVFACIVLLGEIAQQLV